MTKVFAGEATEWEVAKLERWIDEEPGRRELVATLREIWVRSGSSGRSWEPEIGLLEIKSRKVRPEGYVEVPRSRSRTPVGHESPRVSPRRRRSAPAMWRAAAVLAAVGLGAAIWQMAPHLTPFLDGDETAMTEHTTLRGQRATLRLADGSRVTLGPQTKIRYRKDFGRDGRELHLTGQGYFEVARNEARPFTVRTTAVVARALGTRFGVRAYPEDAEVEVAVAEGRVAVAPTRPSGNDGDIRDPNDATRVVLERNDLARVDLAGGIPQVQHGIDSAARVAWTEGRLVFDGAPLGDVLTQLGRWYDLDIHLADGTLAEQRVTASFANEPALQVLGFLASAADARLERHGRRITFAPREDSRRAR